jgi:Gpi18-like mannosyltransferase
MNYKYFGDPLRPQTWATLWRHPLFFVIGTWAISRLLIIIMMQLVAPALPFAPAHVWLAAEPEPLPGFTPKLGWDLFTHWDGVWYEKVATQGYDYFNDNRQNSIAFFPLFPLLIYLLMKAGVTFAVAGTLINNLAFLSALVVLYRWVEPIHGANTARWATAILAWCPFSLFGTVTYTEGLFLLCTTAALRAFDQQQYRWAAFWGALATATRAPGIVLVPSFLIVAWREKRPPAAYLAAIAASSGILLFSLYCAIQFQDPLAFWREQQSWTHAGWGALILEIVTKGPLALNSSTKLFVLLGSSWLFWWLRNPLGRVAMIYGYCSLALLLVSGATASFNRFAFAIVSISFAVGLWLAQHPRWGYFVITCFVLGLARLAIRFAWWDWVA